MRMMRMRPSFASSSSSSSSRRIDARAVVVVAAVVVVVAAGATVLHAGEIAPQTRAREHAAQRRARDVQDEEARDRRERGDGGDGRRVGEDDGCARWSVVAWARARRGR